MAVYEVMPFWDGLKELIINGASTAELKGEAVRLGMQTLRAAGLSVAMLTGDNQRTAEAVARRLVATHGSGQPPFVTSRDLYRELKGATPPEYHYLLKDFLETITLWNLRTTAIAAEPAGNGAWRVTLDVEAQKFRAGGSGQETEVPMHDFAPVAAKFRRDENDITVDFVVDIDPTATGAAELRLSLPVDPGPDFAADSDLIGMAFSSHPATQERIAYFRDAAQD